MNSLLRIQVKILAQEANRQLQQLANGIRQVNSASRSGGGGGATDRVQAGFKATNSELNKIQKNLDKFAGHKAFRDAARDADRYQQKLDEINRSIGAMSTGNRHNGPFSLTGGESENVAKGQAASAAAAKSLDKQRQASLKAAAQEAAVAQKLAAQKAAAAVKAAQQEAAAAQKAREAEHQAGARSVQQQIDDRRRASQQQQAAAREAADVAVKEARRVEQEVKKSAQQAANEQKQIERAQKQYMKQIWDEQVRNYKAAKQAEVVAAEKAADAKRAAEHHGLMAGTHVQTADGVKQLTGLGRLSMQVNGTIDTTRKGMIQMGKDMQWVGRQINFNFTIPLILAGKAIVGFALDNERAFTQLQKVYGDGSRDYTEELNKIKTGVTTLSEIFGENRSDVMQLAAAWAAAGAEGGDLLAATANSLKLAVLGDYDKPIDTFQALISIQQAYQLSSEELAEAIAKLNLVENTQASSLQDLVTGISLAGSSARTAGVDMDHLAAMMSVLVPATGSASRAGNALKTILTNLVAPTQKMQDALGMMGIEFYDASYQALDASQRLELIAQTFETLTSAQQVYISKTLGNLWQVDKFNQLMKDLSDTTGTYNEVLNDLKDPSKAIAGANRELQTLLQSDPKKFERLIEMIKNTLADIILPLIPAILTVLGMVQKLVSWFSSLSPEIQKAAGMFLLFVAAIGILAQMFGSVQLLFGTFLKFMIFMIGLIPGVGLTASATAAEVAAASAASSAAIAAEAAAMTATIAAESVAMSGVVATEAAVVSGIAAAASTAATGAAIEAGAAITVATGGTIAIIGAIIAAVIALSIIIVKNWDTIVKAVRNAVKWIGENIGQLPQIVANALMSVLRVVANIMTRIIDWLSYLNPFARHSPSLVDNVTAGVRVILAEYAKLGSVAGVFLKASTDLKAFNVAVQDAINLAKQMDRNETKMSVTQASPQGGAMLDTLFGDMDALQAELDPINKAMDEQQRIVDVAKDAFDAASAAVDRFDASLQPLRDTVDSISQSISESRDKIEELARTSITGMGAMEDSIFENEMAQKRLRLEIMKLESAGESYDQIKDKIAALNGEIEGIRAKMSDLRQAGAGSDILGFYQDQLDGLEAQKAGLEGSAQQSKELEDQLAELQRQGEIMDLEKSLNFDGLLRQIDKLANGVKEMDFDDIVSGIQAEQTNIDQLTKSYDENKKALDEQEAILKQMQDSRDILKQSYQDEQDALDKLKDKYQLIADKLKEIEDAIAAVVSANKTLSESGAGGGGGGGAGGGGGFDDLGDFGEEAIPEFDAEGLNIDDVLKDLTDQLNGLLGDINPFGFIGDIGSWIMDKLKVAGSAIVEGLKWIGDQFLDLPGIILDAFVDAHVWLFDTGMDILTGLWDGIKEIAPDIWDWLKELPGKMIRAIPGALNWLTDTGMKVTKGLAIGMIDGFFWVLDFMIKLPFRLGELLYDAVNWLFDGGYKTIWGFLQGILSGALEVAGWFMGLGANILGWIGDALSWLFQTGIDLALGLMAGIVDVAPGIMEWFQSLPGEILGWIGDVAKHLWQKGVDFIQGLWDGVGDKIIAVGAWFSDLPNKVLGWIGNVASTLWTKGWELIKGLGDGILAKALEVASWFISLPGQIVTWVGLLGSTLWMTGWDVIQGLIGGIVEAGKTVWHWFESLAQKIIDTIPNPLDILYNVGKAIIQGIWNGMKAVWKDVAGWLGGLAGDIVGLKGPPSYDATILVGNGQLIMEGLLNGMKDGWAEVESWMSGLSTDIAGTVSMSPTDIRNLGASQADLIARAGAVSFSGGGATTTNLTFTGDLSFPNITDPDDADKFLSNLENLAGV